MEYLLGGVWVLIPLAAIIMKGIREMMEVRSQQQRLGASNDVLEKRLESVEGERRQLVERVQNLEAIVTSRVWDAAREAAVAQDPEHRRRAAARVDLALPREEPPRPEPPPPPPAPSISQGGLSQGGLSQGGASSSSQDSPRRRAEELAQKLGF